MTTFLLPVSCECFFLLCYCCCCLPSFSFTRLVLHAPIIPLINRFSDDLCFHYTDRERENKTSRLINIDESQSQQETHLMENRKAHNITRPIAMNDAQKTSVCMNERERRKTGPAYSVTDQSS